MSEYTDINTMNNVLSAHNELKEVFNQFTYDSVLFAKFTNILAFADNTGDSGYNTIKLNDETTYRDVYTKGNGIIMPSNTLMEFNLPGNYDYIEGIVVYRQHVPTQTTYPNCYVQAVLRYGENLANSSVLGNSIAYNPDKGFDRPLQFFHPGRTQTHEDMEHQLAIQVYGEQTFDYMTVLIKAHQFTFN